MKIQINKKKIAVFIYINFCITAFLLGQTNSITTNNSIIISQSVENEIKKLVHKGNLPSLQIAVISNTQHISIKTYGQDVGKTQLYKIGSVRKMFGATTVLQLHERGLINIHEDINKYITISVRNPDFPDIPITIKMLLSHRSGLDIFQNQYEWDTRKLDYDKNVSTNLLEILTFPKDKFLKESLDTTGINYNPAIWKFKPGKGFHYSNSAFLILEYLVEQVTGQSYEQFVLENIFEPLEMNDSKFIYHDSTGIFVPAYTRKGMQNIELPFWEGMYSNAEDMAKFMMMHLNYGKYKDTFILEPATVDLMHEKHSREKSLFYPLGDCPFPGYGLGIIYYGDEWYGHGGSTIGYQSLWSFNKLNKKGYIIFTNINGLCHGEENFDSVWSTVSSVEKLVKSELGNSTNGLKFYIAILIIGIIATILFIRKRRMKKVSEIKNYAT